VSRTYDYDVVVIGAGHNGLAATALLAARGLRVLCLEKNAYVGGMAGTREILSGCRNDVGASLLFPLAKGLEEELGSSSATAWSSSICRSWRRT
jgi:phytoene dehydrogenase-like protein